LQVFRAGPALAVPVIVMDLASTGMTALAFAILLGCLLQLAVPRPDERR
jgi:hypothetical protein